MSSTAFRGWVRSPATSGSTWWTSGCGTGSTHATTAGTCRTCATGPGRTKRPHPALPQRGREKSPALPRRGKEENRMRVLVLNAGSSSLKGSIVDTVDLAAIAKDEDSLGPASRPQKGMEATVRSLLRKLGVLTPRPSPPPQGGREYSEQ